MATNKGFHWLTAAGFALALLVNACATNPRATAPSGREPGPSTLPGQGAVVTYWWPQVGIGPEGQMKYVDVPLSEVLKYKTDIVVLAFATFSSTQKPYINIPDSLVKQMTLQPGQTRTNVQQLQDRGIKVLLSVLNDGPNGWDGITSNEDFGETMQLMLRKYGLDGLDIDDEYDQNHTSSANPQAFVNTIGTLRGWLRGYLLTKALFADDIYFQTPVASGHPNAGKSLAEFLDYGWTMSYWDDCAGQAGLIQEYHDLGMPWNKLAIGVQAGPYGHGQFTQIDEVYKSAQSSVGKNACGAEPPNPPIFGMMLYTFSQDIQQFTHWPQNAIPYPNSDDHQWQRTIIAGLTGKPMPPH